MSNQPARIADRLGPWAVVVGASGGIGAAFARLLAAEGLNLVLVARRSAPLEALADEIRASSSVEVRLLVLDLLAAEGLSPLDEATAGLEVGLIVDAAGAGHGAARFLEQAEEEVARYVRLDCLVTVELVHRFAGPMTARGRGGILLLSAMSSVAGSGLSVVPGAAKAFVQSFAEGLWAELSQSGVDVLCLIPGVTDTPSLRRSGAVVGGADLPGLAPAAVAAAGIAHLADGPVWVVDETARLVHGHLASLPRGEAAGLLELGARRIFGLEPMEEL